MADRIVDRVDEDTHVGDPLESGVLLEARDHQVGRLAVPGKQAIDARDRAEPEALADPIDFAGPGRILRVQAAPLRDRADQVEGVVAALEIGRLSLLERLDPKRELVANRRQVGDRVDGPGRLQD
jgi:hypothetical protein